MRPEKSSIVSDLSDKLGRSPFVLVTDYQRMNVNHFADLRNRLAASGAEMTRVTPVVDLSHCGQGPAGTRPD